MEPYFPADRPVQMVWIAFIYNTDCYYSGNSFYFRECLRGRNCVFLNNQERFLHK